MDEYARFLDGLISTYGKLSAQGLMQRIGRVTFQNVRRQFEAIKNLGTTEHRMTPLRKRLEGDLLEMGRILADSMGCQLAVNPEGRDWYVAISGCIGIKDHDSLSSYFIKGLLEKFLEWSDSRKDYRVEEIDTPKDAVSCIFRIQILLVE